MQNNGLLLVDKPAGMTSHDVVAKVRRALKQKSVGHTGTLDPLATGLLVLVLGDATKLSDYLIAEDKSYQLKVRLGVTTDTLDVTGTILSEKACALPKSEIEIAVQSLEGDFEWEVPLFSAAKVDGKKLYEHGRAGTGNSVELPTKLMSFWEPEIVDTTEASVTLDISCSKGSFVRTWAAKLGEALGVGGAIEQLRRTRVGSFLVENAATLEQIEADGWSDAFIPMNQALPGLKTVLASPRDQKLVGNGQIPRDIENRLIVAQKTAYASNRSVYVKVVSQSGDLLAILAAEPGQGLKIRRVFRTFA